MDTRSILNPFTDWIYITVYYRLRYSLIDGFGCSTYLKNYI